MERIVSTYSVPLDVLEELMGRDLGERVGAVAAEPVGRVLVQEALEHVGRLDAQRPRYADRLLQDHLEQVVLRVLVRVLRGAGDVERRPSRQHLVQ